MQSYGAKCIASPSNLTKVRRILLKENYSNSGSLGIAINEAIKITEKTLSLNMYSVHF
jgi:tryptophan synthase beta chain